MRRVLALAATSALALTGLGFASSSAQACDPSNLVVIGDGSGLVYLAVDNSTGTWLYTESNGNTTLQRSKGTGILETGDGSDIDCGVDGGDTIIF